MKRTLSFVLAICMLFTSLWAGTTAMADTTKTTTTAIKAQILAAADALVTKDSTFTFENSADFLTYIRSGKDMSAYKEAFVKSVSDALDANKGKLVSKSSSWSQDADGNWVETVTEVESPAVYAATILSLKALGYDTSAFGSYNLDNIFANVDFEKNSDNPYLYRIVLEAMKELNLDAKLTKTVINDLANQYYTLGKGLNYYGYACDNTANFLIAVAPYSDTYSTFVNDAKELLATYKLATGYAYDKTYTTANADSTATALAAYSVMGDLTNAEEAYNALCTFEYKTGQFDYMSNKEFNQYATKDALVALEYFLASLPACYDGHTYVDNGPKCTVCGEANPNYVIPTTTLSLTTQTKTTITFSWKAVEDSEGYVVYKYDTATQKYKQLKKVSKDTTSYKATGLTGSTTYKFKVAVIVNDKIGSRSTALKAVTVPAKTSVSSVKSTAKKKIKVTLKSQTCSGYQIQWSTKSDFSSDYKTTTCSSSATSKTIVTSKSKKKYYVRVRAYKKLGETKYYGAWSSTKTVTVK